MTVLIWVLVTIAFFALVGLLTSFPLPRFLRCRHYHRSRPSIRWGDEEQMP